MIDRASRDATGWISSSQATPGSGRRDLRDPGRFQVSLRPRVPPANDVVKLSRTGAQRWRA